MYNSFALLVEKLAGVYDGATRVLNGVMLSVRGFGRRKLERGR